MAQEIIELGSSPNDGTGDPLRTAFSKTQNNFTELYSMAGSSLAFGTWVGVGAFPNPTVNTLYYVISDHGSPGDADYVPAGAFMIGPAGATTFAEFYIKP